ncbi:MAG: 4Fe-4S binding protein [Pseudomonadales bacterium]
MRFFSPIQHNNNSVPQPSTSAKFLAMLLGLLLTILFVTLLFALYPANTYAASQEQKSSLAKSTEKSPLAHALPIRTIFPKATRVSEKQTGLPVYPVYQLDQLLGYAWLSHEINNLPGFSGQPIKLLIGLQANGVFSRVKVMEHHEPVFLHGLGNEALDQFTDQYAGHSIKKQVIISSAKKSKATSDSAGAVFFDGVTKATISVMIVNDVVLATALQVARDKLEGFSLPSQSALRKKSTDPVESMDWPTLITNGLVHQWNISSDDVFNSLGRQYSDYGHLFDSDDDSASSANSSPDTFTELYYAYLNAPDIGRNLLGKATYEKLMNELSPGDHLVWIGSNGLYRHLADDFMPGTVPSRLSIHQGGLNIEIKDTNVPDEEKTLVSTHAPHITQSAIFKIRDIANFDLGSEIVLGMNINLPRNHLITDSLSLTNTAQLPDSQWIPVDVKQQTQTPLWIRIWQDRIPQIVILLTSLVILFVAFIKQEKISSNAVRFHQFRWAYLWFTLLFIGYYAQGQLSVVNIFTLLHAIGDGFDITIFLLDPIIFILWVVTFISLFIIGRGLFCGWLCPFGALQEMASWCGKKLGIKQIRVSENKHRKLIYLKYPILIGLVAVSFYELSLAERLAEVEPFKTSITLVFARHWPFVLYALALLVGGMFIHKFYCRYLCALGAGLAILGALRRFEWLKRIPFCGTPCQTCHNRCEIKAIKRDGEIDYNECVQCLECIVILNSDEQCADTLLKRKKQKRINCINIGAS